jgi:MtfA peptidase
MFFFKKIRRKRIRQRSFPEVWIDIIRKNVFMYNRLSPADQQELHGHINIFLAEKHFEGCAGLEITDEIRVTIAAQACILLLHRATDYYPKLITILVYPHAYIAHHRERNSIGLVTEEIQGRLGESWALGTVVLSWDHVRAGASDIHDGHNVVFHEFAHQLDIEDGRVANGSVILPRRSMYIAWARILGREYAALRREVAAGRKTVLDSYGATNPAEFFAVATECFFEKPIPLKKKHPELYEELKLFYQQDPVCAT